MLVPALTLLDFIVLLAHIGLYFIPPRLMMYGTMKIYPGAFNTIFLLIWALHLSACKTSEEKKKEKEVTVLRVHMEAKGVGQDRASSKPIGRGPLMYLNVDQNYFVSEGDVVKAAVVDNTDDAGGWSMAVQFDAHGTLLLDSMTSRYKGDHLAIWLRADEALWVAAPLITHRITNGLLVFTPDVSKEGAVRMVRGLNNIAKKIHRNDLIK